LIERPDQPPDRSTRVSWLQGPRFFVDLRQPADRPSFGGVDCLRDLELPHLEWLARQEGFAGETRVEDDIVEWVRKIDFQPDSGTLDRGRVQLNGQVLTEIGLESAYLELWQRDTPAPEPCWGARLADLLTADVGYIVRAGNTLMFARARARSLPECRDLSEALSATMPLGAQQDLLDFEISFGALAPSGEEWTIERSTLPYKEGRAVAISVPNDGGDVIECDDWDQNGHKIRRRWRIAELDSPVTDIKGGAHV
jgi:hypothetical protein